MFVVLREGRTVVLHSGGFSFFMSWAFRDEHLGRRFASFLSSLLFSVRLNEWD